MTSYDAWKTRSPDDERDQEHNTGPDDLLGSCCNCGSTERVTNILMIARRGPLPGKGWGCVVCDLPFDGAVAVLCDECIKIDGPPRSVCVGDVKDGKRMPYDELEPEEFDHDMAKHASDETSAISLE